MQSNMPDKPKRSTLFTIFYLAYFASFGNPLIIPLYPQIMSHFQISYLEIGLLISLFALPGVFVIPVLGFLQDKLGRRLVLVGALVLCFVASFGLVVSNNFFLFLLCRTVQGLSVTPLEAMSHTLITDNYTGEERQLNISRNTSALFIGVATFPLLVTAMLYAFGWRAALLLPCIMVLPLLLLCLKLPMRYEHAHFQWDSYRANLKHLLTSARLLGLFGIRISLALIMFATIHTYMPFLVMDKLGGGGHLPGIYFSLYSGAMSVGSLSLGWFIARFFAPVSAMGANLLMAAAVLGFALAPSVQLLVPALLLCGFGYGLLSALNVAYIARNTTEDTRGTVLSLSSTVFRVAQVTGPPLAGLLFGLGGFSLLYCGAALAALALLALTRTAFRP